MWPLDQMTIKLIKLAEILFKYHQFTSDKVGQKVSIFIQNQCINLYDFGFGMNRSGVIKDGSTKKTRDIFSNEYLY